MKSLNPGNGLAYPAFGVNVIERPSSVLPDGSLFVIVTVWDVGLEPTNWGGKDKTLGVTVIGSEQSVPDERQTFPTSCR